MEAVFRSLTALGKNCCVVWWYTGEYRCVFCQRSLCRHSTHVYPYHHSSFFFVLFSLLPDLPQHHVYREKEEVLNDQQLCNQERNANFDQEDPAEPPQMKEEQEELCTSQKEEQLVVKLESDNFMFTPAFEDSDHSDPEPESDHQLPSDNFHVAESENQNEGKHGDSGSSRNTEPEPNEEHHKTRSPNMSVYKPNQSEVDCNSIRGKKSFKCDSCGKDLKCKSKLNVHMRTHTGEKPYSCKTCGKRFTVISVLKRHMRIHTGEKPYSCNTCGRHFRIVSDLKVHMRIHTGLKPYSCITCGKGFSRSNALTAHLRVHTGERPYLCKTCGKRYSDISGLKRHLRIHTGEKPYSCNTCGKDFRDGRDLKVHMRVHTGEKPFSFSFIKKILNVVVPCQSTGEPTQVNSSC